MDMHPGQLTVPVETVRELVGRQFPQGRGLPIRAVPLQGTVNALFRVGERWVARFPLVAGEVDEMRRRLRSEANAARELLGRTRFPTPEPVALGEPAAGCPTPWSVYTWLPGTVATVEDPGKSPAFARDLGGFIRDVRAIGTGGRTFAGPGRGGQLPDHDDWVRTCLRRSEQLLDVAPLRRLWDALRDLPPAAGGDLMTHGDLIPGNVLVTAGRLAGVIDVGGAGPADPALDLVCAWHLLEAGPRQALRDELGCDDREWARGAAWSLEQALGLVWYYVETNPAMSRTGRRTLQRLLADPPPVP